MLTIKRITMPSTFCPCLPDNIELEEEELSKLFRRMKHSISEPIAGEEIKEIWRKFELPPTPPRSPVKTEVEITHYESTVADRLQRVSESLDEEDCPEITALNLGSKLIQDCMWSWNGKVNQTGGKSSTDVNDIYETPCSTPPPLDYTSTDCVDPTAVFPYSLNEADQSHSEDTDEEIDVVTVNLEKPRLKRQLSEPTHKLNRIVPPLKRSKSSPATNQIKSSEKKIDDMGEKDKDNSTSPPAAIISTPKSENIIVSHITKKKEDDEDSSNPNAKRAFHNVLERKRRNDLKSCFYSLRNHIPSLEKKEKTPKVNILKDAVDYVHELKARETQLSKEKEELKKARGELLEKMKTIVVGAKYYIIA